MKVLLELAGTPAEFLAQMGAIENFKKINDSLEIHAYTPHDDYLAIARKAWFIKKAFDTKPDETPYVFVHSMSADMEKTRRAEIEKKKQVKDILDKNIEEFAKSREIEVEAVNKPKDYEKLDPNYPPQWGIVNGYAFGLEEASGWGCAPLNRLPPYAHSCPDFTNKVNKYLHENRKHIRPGTKYILVSDPEKLSSFGLELTKPDSWDIVSVDDETDLTTTLGLISNSRCALVAGMDGAPTLAAYRFNKPYIAVIENPHLGGWTFYDGPNPYIAAQAYGASDSFLKAIMKIIKETYE